MPDGQLKILTKMDLATLRVNGVGPVNIIDWEYWDTQTIPTAAPPTSYVFFKESFGGNVTLETTNMDIPGQLMKGYQFVIEQISVRAIPNVAKIGAKAYVTDQVAAFNAGRAQLFIGGGRPFYQCDMWKLAGGNLQGFASAFDATTATAFAQARWFTSGKLAYMPLIDSNTAFYVQVDYDVAPDIATTALSLRTYLTGKLIRPNSA